MTKLQAPQRIRLTITVDSEVRDVFAAMAETAGVSLGKCMGDWLADTMDGAQFVAQKMAEAKRSPKTVMRELQSMAGGLQELIGEQIGAGGPPPAGRTRAAQRAVDTLGSLLPPSSNTGGKVPGKTRSTKP